MGQPRVEQTPKGQVQAALLFPTIIWCVFANLRLLKVIIFPVRLNINQKGLTIEELTERRKVIAPPNLTFFFAVNNLSNDELLFSPNMIGKDHLNIW